MEIHFHGKTFLAMAKETNFLTRISGLMFRTKETENLLFDFGQEGRWAIHSLFVFFPFLALWLDRENNVLEYKVVKPFELSAAPSQDFAKLVEIPLNSGNRMKFSSFLSDY